MWGLLEDFPNLKAGGLLPDPGESKEKGALAKSLEWKVAVFPQGRGRSKKVIHLDSSFNHPPPEEDWARYPCCGTICAVLSAPMRKPTDRECFGPTPQ